MFYPRGEERAARAAGDAGTIYTLSTLSGCRLEDVKAATTGNAWYQLYLVGGRDVAMGAIARAKAARLQGAGRHHRHAGGRHARARFAQRRQGAARAQPVDGAVPRPDAGAAVAGSYRFFGDGGLMNFPNIVIADGPMGYADVGAALEAVDDVVGRLHVDPRRVGRADRRQGRAHRGRCAAGGRRKAPPRSWCRITAPGSSMAWRRRSACCRKWSQAVNGQTEILLDGGIRRGSDIVKALCMGARAVLIGRAYAYGLGAGGDAGVARAIEILADRRRPHDETPGLRRHQRSRRFVRRRPVRVDRPPAAIGRSIGSAIRDQKSEFCHVHSSC